MQTLVLAVALALATVLQAQDPLPLPLEARDVNGTWYPKAIMADRALAKEQKPRALAPLTMTALEGGDVQVSFTFMKKGQCHRKSVTLQQTGEPGRYRTFSGSVAVYLLELPLGGQLVLYVEGRVHMGTLLGRSPDSSPEALAAFRRLMRRKGLASESLFVPALTENCVPQPT